MNSDGIFLVFLIFGHISDSCCYNSSSSSSIAVRSVCCCMSSNDPHPSSPLWQDTYEGGATGEEAQSLRSRIDQLESQREGLRREVTRCRELADVAAEQAQALGQHRSDQEEEINALQSQVSELESRSDDDIIIGSLQRKLMATKAEYKAFARKFELMRSGLRKKSAAVHVFEVRLDAKDEELMNARDMHHIQVCALKKALWKVSNCDVSNLDDFEKMPPPRQLNGWKIPENNLNLISLSHLSKILEIKTSELTAAQRAKMDAETETNRTKLELSGLKSLVADLESAATITTSIDASQTEVGATLAQRIISLSNELKTSKLEAFESMRTVHIIHEEKCNLELKVHSLEDIVYRMEEAKAALETQQLLGIPRSSSSIDNAAAISIEMVTGGDDEDTSTTPYPSVLPLSRAGKDIVQLDEVAAESDISTLRRRFDGDPDDIIGRVDDLQQQQSIVADNIDGHHYLTGKLSNAHKQVGARKKALSASKINLQAALKRASASERVAASVERERNMLKIQLQSVREKGRRHDENEERVDENNIFENQDDDNTNGIIDQTG